MTATAAALHAAGPAAQAIRHTESDLGTWLKEVLDGTGASPAQMVITTVLGCIPYVGQALDARNIILAVVALAEDPDNADHWLDLVLSLIALVPGFGDALKNVFKLLRVGKPMGRILDMLPNHLRGNVEQWFRSLDWVRYTRDLTALADDLLAKLIGVFDGWLTRAVMGNARVREVLEQLERVQQRAHQKIEEAMQGLQRQHAKAMSDPLPNTTAHAPAAKVADKMPPPGSSSSGKVKTTTGGTHAPAEGSANAQHRQSPPQRSNAGKGASGEHITDYYFVKRNKNRAKVNNLGVLWEYQQPGHAGIDHVWHHERLPFKYRVTDTKATGKLRHMKLMTPKAAFEALRMGLDIYFGQEDEKQVQRSVGATVGDGLQLSHKWVTRKMLQSNISQAHRGTLRKAMEKWRRDFNKDAAGEWRLSGRAPYDRSLVTVVGPNMDHHDQSKTGHDCPKCTRPLTAHQIAAEFILPTEMLFE